MPGRGKQALVLGVANKRPSRGRSPPACVGGARWPSRTRASGSRSRCATSPRRSTPGFVTECDVRSDEDLDRVFAETADAFGGGLDVLVHSVAAFAAAAEDLEGRSRHAAGPLLAGGRHQRVLARRGSRAGRSR